MAKRLPGLARILKVSVKTSFAPAKEVVAEASKICASLRHCVAAGAFTETHRVASCKYEARASPQRRERAVRGQCGGSCVGCCTADERLKVQSPARNILTDLGAGYRIFSLRGS